MRFPRWPAIVVIAAVVAGLVILDQRERPSAESTLDVTSPSSMPAAPPGGSLGSTWYCAGGTVAPAGFADHEVVVANPGDRDVSGTMTVYGAQIAADETVLAVPPVTAAIRVAPGAVERLVLAELIGAGYAAALLELDSSEVVVEHVVSGPTGTGSAPCSTAASENWYFPGGATSRDARQVLALFNPFPDEAVVDITFATDDGGRAPQRFDNLVVPGGSLVPVDVTEVVSRWDQLSTTVAVQAGRLVADRLVTWDGSRGLTGLSVSAGAPQTALQWIFPLGETSPGVTDSYVVYNPNEVSAEVDVEVRLDNPDQNGQVEPFELTVPPRQRVVVVVNDTPVHPKSATVTVATGARVPVGVDHWVGVVSFNGVPVVAERVRTAVAPGTEGAGDPPAEPADEPDGGGGGAGDPADAGTDEPLDGSLSPETEEPDPAEPADPATSGPEPVRGGVAMTMGAPLASTRLVVGLNEVSDTVREQVAVVNPSFVTISRVSVSVVTGADVTPVAELQDIELAPRRRLEIPDLGQLVDPGAFLLVIEATAPVVAERSLAPVGVAGLVTAMATPVGGELVTPELLGFS